MRKQKMPLTLVSLIFGFVGIMFLISTVIWTKVTYEFSQTAEPVEGIISEIARTRDSDGDISYIVYVSYTFQGEWYEDVRIGTYSSSMHEGDGITLLCNPDKPTDVKSESFLYTGPIIFGILSVIMLAVSGGIIGYGAYKSASKKRLIEAGYVLHAKVEGIERNRMVRVNYTHPYVIYCSYQDPFNGVTYRFKSDNLWTNPQEVFAQGSMIDVYVDQNNYSKYYVAAEEVLQQRIVDFT